MKASRFSNEPSELSLLKRRGIYDEIKIRSNDSLGARMYNPNNLELPEIDDPRLTEYLHTAEWDLVQIIAFRSDTYGELLPDAVIETEGPYYGSTDFHWISPDGSESEPALSMHGPLEGKSEVFDLEQLNPLDSDFEKVKSYVWALHGSSEEVDERTVESWYEEASEGGFDKVRIFRERYYAEWVVRAWEGLTLDDFDPHHFPGPSCTFYYMSFDESNYQAQEEDSPDARLIETLSCGVGLTRLQVRTEIESEENSGLEPKKGLWAAIRGFFQK